MSKFVTTSQSKQKSPDKSYVLLKTIALHHWIPVQEKNA